MVNPMPDIMLSILNHLRSSSELTSFNVTKICPDLTGYESGQSWIKVRKAPGTAVIDGRLDACQIDFNCYAETRDETERLASAARAAILNMKGYTDEDEGVVVTFVETNTTPFDMTDPVDNQYRYVFDVTVFFRPY